MKHASKGARRVHIYFASVTWDWYWIIQQPICNQIKEREPVLYVDRFVSVFTILRYPELWRRLFLWVRGPRRVEPNLQVLPPLPLFHLGHRFPRLFKLEFAIQRWWIRWWASRLPVGDRILWVDNPLYECALGTMGERVSIYHLADEISAFASSHAEAVLAQERALFPKVDLVFAASDQLAADKQRFHPRVTGVWNAMDPAVFDAPEPGELVLQLEKVQSPRVAYVGSIESWVDVDLLALTASRLSHVQFILVGPTIVSDRPLRGLKNVHMLGSQPRFAIPAVLRRCSASLIPFKKNRLTERVLPIKVFEALAAGIRPVATPFSVDLDRLEQDGYVAVGRSSDAFVAAVERAIVEDLPSQRERYAAFGRRQTWAERWRQMDGVIRGYMASADLG